MHMLSQSIPQFIPSFKRLLLTGLAVLCIAVLPRPAFSAESPAKTPLRTANAPINDYLHSIFFHSLPGLPSTLTMEGNRDVDLRRAQLLATIDDRLLVLDLQYDPSLKNFSTQFPTPEFSMNYRFLLVYRNGETKLSGYYEASPRCGIPALTIDEGERFPGQHQLIKEVLALGQDSILLTHSEIQLQNLLEAP